MHKIAGWNYYEDGEFCRFYSLSERAEMERTANAYGGTYIPASHSHAQTTAITASTVVAASISALNDARF
jgi:hypothetical protein